MVEYGVLASKSSEIFSNFYWQIRNIWNDVPFVMAALIVFGILAMLYFLLRNR